MRRFTAAALAYITICLAAIGIIVLRGDGPHPIIVAVYPFNGDRYWPGGTAEIAFSQPMNQSSVERALQVSPGSQGQGAWFGNILNLQPVGDWKPNVTYHVALVGAVTDDEGRPLRTPVKYWFRVHVVQHLTYCRVHEVRNVCERLSTGNRPLTASSRPVLAYALAPDGTLLAYVRRDASGVPHLFIIGVDRSGARQLTFGTTYADSKPFWSAGDTTSIAYYRRPILRHGGGTRLGKAQLWSVLTDGSNNTPL